MLPTERQARRHDLRGRVAGRLALLALVLWVWTAAPGQVRPVAIEGATIFTGDGATIESGRLLFQGGKITGVGRDVSKPFLARSIDAKGKYITPGLIDAYSTLTLGVATAGGQAVARAADAFDPYDRDDLRAALAQGVTAAFVPARAAGGVGGLGAVVRLRPGASREEVVLKDDAALCAALNPEGRQRPVERVRALVELRKVFRAAREYRESWDTYLEDLKEYEEKLAERAKKGESGGDDTRPKPETKPGESRPGPAGKAQERKDEPKGSDAKAEEKKDELKKPTAPGIDRNLAQILKALDGELRVHIEAHEPADILNVLELAAEFNLALVLDGAAGAGEVAPRLAAAGIPVVLASLPAPLAFTPGPDRLAQADVAARLRAAGVEVYFGSGHVPSGATPVLALQAARAIGQGYDDSDALATLTSRAARMLGVADQVGRLASGLQADVVVWSDHPFAAGARVERVFIAGREVYVAGGAAQEGGE
ncbi:MAG: amidohydrolase family protein [Phycisphaerales bacterium]|nr:amidohydrolase family protein [Phycisphaerales bacterium]